MAHGSMIRSLRNTTIDALAEKDRRWSPYSYGHNNPIRFIDVDGLFVAPGDLFATADAAASDFGSYYNGRSIAAGREYASSVYKVVKDGKTYYSYSEANKGTLAGSSPSASPDGTETVAYTHTHGNYVPSYGTGNDNFSGDDGDIGYANTNNIDGYVATPDGSFKKYDVKTKQVTTLSTDKPSDPDDPDRKNNISPDADPSIKAATNKINDAGGVLPEPTPPVPQQIPKPPDH